MDTLEILKYIGLGIVSIIGFCIALAVIGGMLRLLLDIVVFIIITPFYIFFHPIMFITKPKICFRNIFMKMPNLGENMRHAEFCKKHKITVTETDLAIKKQFEEWAKEDQFFRDTYGTDIWGHKIK